MATRSSRQLDRARTHPARWHVATLTFDGATMTHYVDGVRELSGPVAFKPLRAGRTSIGVRQNLISWFKGRISEVRITSSVLDPRDFLKVPPRVIEIWPEGVPGIRADRSAEREVDGRIENVHVPTLTYYPPAPGTANGTAVIACAGGSYARLAMSNEIAGITPVLTSHGVAVFALKYRLAEYGHPAPLRDVLRAIRLVRSRAEEFGLRADRIGVFGASAGGHLAASAATLYDADEGRTGAAARSHERAPGLRGASVPGDHDEAAVCSPGFAYELAWPVADGGADRSAVARRPGAKGDAAGIPAPHGGGQDGADRKQP